MKVRIGKVALTMGGAWRSDVSYAKLTYVTYNGDGWISVSANLGCIPGTDITKWRQATDVQSFITAMQEATATAVQTNEELAAAELLRVQAENLRVQAENLRVQAESTRTSQEASRVAAEASRVAEEAARVSAEAARVRAETLREQAEATRQSASAAAVSAADAATVAAQSATSAANNAATLANQKAELANAAAEAANTAAASVDQKVRDAFELPVFEIDEETMELTATEVPLADQFTLDNGNLIVDF